MLFRYPVALYYFGHLRSVQYHQVHRWLKKIQKQWSIANIILHLFTDFDHIQICNNCGIIQNCKNWINFRRKFEGIRIFVQYFSYYHFILWCSNRPKLSICDWLGQSSVEKCTKEKTWYFRYFTTNSNSFLICVTYSNIGNYIGSTLANTIFKG